MWHWMTFNCSLGVKARMKLVAYSRKFVPGPETQSRAKQYGTLGRSSTTPKPLRRLALETSTPLPCTMLPWFSGYGVWSPLGPVAKVASQLQLAQRCLRTRLPRSLSRLQSRKPKSYSMDRRAKAQKLLFSSVMVRQACSLPSGQQTKSWMHDQVPRRKSLPRYLTRVVSWPLLLVC